MDTPPLTRRFSCAAAECPYYEDVEFATEIASMAHGNRHQQCSYWWICDKTFDTLILAQYHEETHDQAFGRDFECTGCNQKHPTLIKYKDCEISHQAKRNENGPNWICTELKDDGTTCNAPFKGEERSNFVNHLSEHNIPPDKASKVVKNYNVTSNGQRFWCKHCGRVRELKDNEFEYYPDFHGHWQTRRLDHLARHMISLRELQLQHGNQEAS